VIYFYIKTN